MKKSYTSSTFINAFMCISWCVKPRGFIFNSSLSPFLFILATMTTSLLSYSVILLCSFAFFNSPDSSLVLFFNYCLYSFLSFLVLLSLPINIFSEIVTVARHFSSLTGRTRFLHFRLELCSALPFFVLSFFLSPFYFSHSRLPFFVCCCYYYYNFKKEKSLLWYCIFLLFLLCCFWGLSLVVIFCELEKWWYFFLRGEAWEE